jgi:hypothetical protein
MKKYDDDYVVETNVAFQDAVDIENSQGREHD